MNFRPASHQQFYSQQIERILLQGDSVKWLGSTTTQFNPLLCSHFCSHCYDWLAKDVLTNKKSPPSVNQTSLTELIVHICWFYFHVNVDLHLIFLNVYQTCVFFYSLEIYSENTWNTYWADVFQCQNDAPGFNFITGRVAFFRKGSIFSIWSLSGFGV